MTVTNNNTTKEQQTSSKIMPKNDKSGNFRANRSKKHQHKQPRPPQQPQPQQPQQRQQNFRSKNHETTANNSRSARRSRKGKPKKYLLASKKSLKRRLLRKRLNKNCIYVQKSIDDLVKYSELELISPIRRFTCRNIRLFAVLYSAILFCRAATDAYIEGMAHQTEQKYFFSRASLDFINGVKLLGIICSLILVAFFSKESHRPLMIFAGALLCCIGSITWPIPYFVNEKYYTNAIKNCSPNSGLGYYYSEICTKPTILNVTASWKSSKDGLNPACSRCISGAVDGSWWNARESVYWLLSFGGLLIGIGTGLFATTGIIYVEENCEKNEHTPLYYGIFMSSMGFGHFIGSCLVWWFLRYKENLAAAVNHLATYESRAWWLGMVVLSFLFLFCSLPFLFFPKYIKKPDWVVSNQYRTFKEMSELLAKLKLKRKELRKKSPKNKKQTADDLANENSQANLLQTGMTNQKELTSEQSRDQNNEDDDDDNFDDDVIENAQTNEYPGSYTNHAFTDNENERAQQQQQQQQHQQQQQQSHIVMIDQPSKGVKFNPVLTSAIELDAETFEDEDSPVRAPPAYYHKKKIKVSKKLGIRCSILKDLLKTPSYSLILAAICISAYYTAGYRTFLGEFVQHEYDQDPNSAWYYTVGLSYSISWSIGPVLGASLIYKLSLQLNRQLLLMEMLLVFHILFVFVMFPLNCNSNIIDDSSLVGRNDSVLSCYDACGCSNVKRELVCSRNDVTVNNNNSNNDVIIRVGGVKYPSMCHAACQLTLTCSCVNLPVNSEKCMADNCSIFGLFWVFLFMATLTYSMAVVIVILFFLRTIHEEHRTMSLSLAIWLIIIIAFVPGRAVYRAIGESTCIEKHTDCLGDSFCWRYDKARLRYVFNGSNIGFQCGALLIFIAIHVLAMYKKLRFEYRFVCYDNYGYEVGGEGPASTNSSPEKSSSPDNGYLNGFKNRNSTDRQHSKQQQQQLDCSNENFEESQEEKLRRHQMAIEKQLDKRNSDEIINNHNNNYVTSCDNYNGDDEDHDNNNNNNNNDDLENAIVNDDSNPHNVRYIDFSVLSSSNSSLFNGQQQHQQQQLIQQQQQQQQQQNYDDDGNISRHSDQQQQLQQQQQLPQIDELIVDQHDLIYETSHILGNDNNNSNNNSNNNNYNNNNYNNNNNDDVYDDNDYVVYL